MKYILITKIPYENYDVEFYDSLKLARMAILNQNDYEMFLIKAKEVISIPYFKQIIAQKKEE